MWTAFRNATVVELFGTISSILISFIGILAAYYYFFVVQKPKIYVNNNKMSSFLQNHIKLLHENYWPSFFYWEGRLQTILSLRKRLPNSVKLPYRRETFHLKDGGELALDYLEQVEELGSKEQLNNNDDGNNSFQDESQKLLVLLLPGLTSSSQTCYIKTLVMAIQNAGASVVVFNNRGIGGIPLKTPRTHNAENSDDIREVIIYLKMKYPNQRMMACGTSLGGMLLCRYLITYPEEAKDIFVTALVISTVWDIWAATENMEVPFINKYIINRGIIQDVIYRVKKNQKVLEQRDCWNFEEVYKSKSGKEFDTRFHVPQFAYKSIEEYYNNCLIVNQTHKFPIPVFGLNSYDDPMMPGKKLPMDEVSSSNASNLALIVTSHGGHLGFLEGFSTKPKSVHYVERLAQQFVQAVRFHGDELKNKK